MDEHILFRDFFGLGNESLLEVLDLLNLLISRRISALELPPPVDVEGLLKLIHEELDLLLLLKQLLLLQVDLLLQVWNTGRFSLGNQQLSLVLSDLLSNDLYVLKSLLVVDLTFLQGGLLNLDLLVKKSQFFVSLDELGAEDVSFVDNHLIVLLLLLLFRLSLQNYVLETGYVTILSLNHLLRRADVVLNLLNHLRQFLILTDEVGMSVLLN